MVRQLLPVLAIALVAVLAIVWVPTAVAGPTIDCGDFDHSTCDELLPGVMADAREALGLPGLVLPMKSVSLSGTEDCLSYSAFLLFDTFGIVSICN